MTPISHTIIISNKRKAVPGAAQEPTENGIEAEITYTPQHGLTPAQEGAEVAKIVRKMNKLCDPAEAGE